ncbi:hypothetical protein L0V05_16290 [Tabrizicola sp. J26]|uniref:hypothetical protein n=1 Tax=Alitabrizicola rongguiensis TaxID=2909234 RepID=UPI001F292912|nr:hypothetical protein [Tabrizicola rongguiensis]MCF1710370.1 hypothetical protein [Tabrizicola rongguiensis]
MIGWLLTHGPHRTREVFEQEISAELPANTQFLSQRQFLKTGATDAAVAYDCAGVYLETDS